MEDKGIELTKIQLKVKDGLLKESRTLLTQQNEWNDLYQVICDARKYGLTGFNILCILSNRYKIEKKN